MKRTAYIILCNEADKPAYVLPNSGDTDLDAVKMLLKHRAEEFIDEQAEMHAELMERHGEDQVDEDRTVLDIAEDGMSARVFTPPLNENCEGFDQLEMSIVAVEVTIRNDAQDQKLWYIEYFDGRKVYFDTEEEAVRSVAPNSGIWTLKHRDEVKRHG